MRHKHKTFITIIPHNHIGFMRKHLPTTCSKNKSMDRMVAKIGESVNTASALVSARIQNLNSHALNRHNPGTPDNVKNVLQMSPFDLQLKFG